MGCDIHMVAQVLSGDRWETVRWPNRLCGKLPDELKLTAEAYGDRSYDVFAILAGIRNGTGFAGCDTGNGFTPIASPRGLPHDFVCVDGDHEGVWMGDHSFSWVTLAELEAYDWEKWTAKRGFISRNERYAMLSRGEHVPENWCGFVSGRNVIHVSIAKMDRLPLAGDVSENEYFALYEWNIRYRDAAGEFYSEWLPRFRDLGEGQSVRLVFGFDN